MPTRRQYRRGKRARGKRRRDPDLATRPRFIPRGLARKRYHATDSKVFYFKTNGEAHSDAVGVYNGSFNTRHITQNPTLFPQFTTLKQIYDQFKVLAIRIKFFPANVGIESHDAALGTDYTLLRGNCITWNDQRADNVLPPLNISEVINNASARMLNARRPFTRSLFRARGFPEWGAADAPVTEDSWNGGINVLVTDATEASTGISPLLWFWTATYKVVFRGRRNQ